MTVGGAAKHNVGNAYKFSVRVGTFLVIVLRVV